MKIFLIKSYSSTRLQSALDAIKATTNIRDIEIVEEQRTREETLNKILSRQFNEDILILVDDIVVTGSWFNDLIKFRHSNRVIGLCMKNPLNHEIQNQGFDLIKIGKSIITKKRIEVSPTAHNEISFAKCFSFTGCLMFIPKEVLSMQILVPTEGENRLGEILYHFLLQEIGVEIGVINNSFVMHYADSTKHNPNKALASQSFLYEKKIWEKALQKFNLEKYVSQEFNIVISDDLQKFILDKKPLFFGAGSVLASILDHLDIKNFEVCSGFQEESGKLFFNQPIKYFKDIDFSNYSRILITAIGSELPIKNLLKNYGLDQDLFFVSSSSNGNTLEYNVKKI